MYGMDGCQVKNSVLCRARGSGSNSSSGSSGSNSGSSDISMLPIYMGLYETGTTKTQETCRVSWERRGDFDSTGRRTFLLSAMDLWFDPIGGQSLLLCTHGIGPDVKKKNKKNSNKLKRKKW